MYDNVVTSNDTTSNKLITKRVQPLNPKFEQFRLLFQPVKILRQQHSRKIMRNE